MAVVFLYCHIARSLSTELDEISSWGVSFLTTWKIHVRNCSYPQFSVLELAELEPRICERATTPCLGLCRSGNKQEMYICSSVGLLCSRNQLVLYAYPFVEVGASQVIQTLAFLPRAPSFLLCGQLDYHIPSCKLLFSPS